MQQIVVIGAGISGLACACKLHQAIDTGRLQAQVQLLEAGSRVGGKMYSPEEEGYLCEWGPNGFLDNKPDTLQFCRELGMEERLLRSRDAARKRFIYAEGRLHQLPENARMFIASKLLSWPAKLRLMKEFIVPPRRDGVDETLADFARRRLGPQALERLIGPMVSGIFAGDPENMSLRSCFPRIHQLEQEYGGLFKAMIKLARQRRAERKAGKQVGGAAGPGGVLTSFPQGAGELVAAAQQALPEGALRLNSPVTAVEQADQGGYQLYLQAGEKLYADRVVFALPAYALSTILQSVQPDLAEIAAEIPYAPMQVVCLGYDEAQIEHDLNGFGYLIPREEGMSILGTLWDSSIFPYRAPEGKVLLRSMMGGATNPQAAELGPEEVQQRVCQDLQTIMGIKADPEFVRIYPHNQAIPQYTPGHNARVRRLEEGLARYEGLYLAGNAFYGVGLNDCVAAAQKTVDKLLQDLEATPQDAPAAG